MGKERKGKESKRNEYGYEMNIMILIKINGLF